MSTTTATRTAVPTRARRFQRPKINLTPQERLLRVLLGAFGAAVGAVLLTSAAGAPGRRARGLAAGGGGRPNGDRSPRPLPVVRQARQRAPRFEGPRMTGPSAGRGTATWPPARGEPGPGTWGPPSTDHSRHPHGAEVHAGHETAGHQGRTVGRGHGLMMIACCIPMLVIAVVLVAAGVVSASFIFVALACTAMMAVMHLGMGHGGHGGGGHGVDGA
jgi:hypothetical protein